MAKKQRKAKNAAAEAAQPDTPSGLALQKVGEPDPGADPHDEAEQQRAADYEAEKRKARWG